MATSNFQVIFYSCSNNEYFVKLRKFISQKIIYFVPISPSQDVIIDNPVLI